MRSKAIGEPPFMYGIAGYFAVLDALRAASGAATAAAAGGDSSGGRGSVGAALTYDLPITPEKTLDFLEGRRPC
jgi:xanthine dehydrogenase molybdopterin-binding subunit B